MSSSRTALIINTNSQLGLHLVRKVASLDYRVISVQNYSPLQLEKFHDYLEYLPMTNPELNDKITNFQITYNAEDDHQSDVDFDISPIFDKIQNVLSGDSIDLIIDLNSTTIKKFEKWDLKLILSLFKTEIIAPHDATVIIGNTNYNSNLTSGTLDYLYNSVTKLSKDLQKSHIDCVDLTQINALPGDESYIADTYLTEVLRNSFKVQHVSSFIDLIKFLIYVYFPGFLISPLLFVFTLLNLQNTLNKQKLD